MPTRSLNVVITGDAKGIGIAAREADGHLRVVQRSAKVTGDALKLGFGLAAGAALVGVGFLKKSADAAKEAETSHARLVAQLKASGISYHAHSKEIDAVIQRHSKLAGIDDEDLQDAFTNLVRSTGSVSKSMKDMGLVTDIARGKHISVTKAADLLGKVHAGNTGILKRYGIAFDPVTKAQDKLKDSHVKATAEQIKAAKATDKTATSQKAIAELQKRFGGQAEAYGKTAAGAQERFGVAVENVEEKLGAKLLPVLAKVAGGVAKFLEQMDSGKGVGGAFAHAISTGFNTVKNVIGAVVRAVRKFLQDHRQDIQDVIHAFQRVAAFAKSTWQDTLLPIVKRTVAAIKPIIEGLISTVRGVIRLVSGLLSGNWSKAWNGAKEAVSGAWKVIKTLVKTGIGDLWDLLKDLGPKLVKLIARGMGNLGKALATGIWEGIKAAAKAVPGLAGDALKAIGKTITHFISSGFGKLNPFGDGTGFTPGGSIPGLGGGGSLMGADPDLAPFASLASGMGLHTSSGLRVGATTISGNKSFHATGDAIDEVGPFGAMRNYASALFHQSGGPLRERISPFPQFGIKDGRPYRYPADVQAQHSGANAHVHVAYTGPFGDGLGFDAVAQLAESVGLPGVTFAQIAHGESGYRPGAIGHDPGGTTGYGLWQITSGYNDDIIAKYGGPHALLDPRTNALAARDIWRRQGKAAWYGTRYVKGWNLHYKGKGGKVPFVSHPGSSGSDPASEHAAAVRNARLAAPGPSVAKGLTARQIAASERSGGDTGGGDTGDPNQALIDAQVAAKEAADALAAELKAVRASIDAQTDFAKGVAATSNFQLTKNFADLMSGHIVGYGVAGRAFTPGTGVEYAY